MALFQKLQRTVCKLTRPVVQKANTTELALSEEDEETCDYAVALQNCLIGLANEVYGVADPIDISGRVLRQACDFYDADWCGLFDVDRMLKLLVPFWWYNRTTGGMTKTKLDEGGVYGDFTRWMDALNTNTPIYVDDIEKIKESNPEEYAVYSKQEVRSILAVPYHKREKGFLLLRNPKRYGDKPEMLQIMANILVAEINEQKHLDRMKAESENMDTSAEIIINLFGGFEIITNKGTLSEAEIKSPLACKLLVLLMMNRHRSMTGRELADAIWPDADYTDPTGKLRTLLYRFRTTFRLLSDKELIVTSANGYRINGELSIRTDYEDFEKICDVSMKAYDRYQKKELLCKAIKLYRGKLFPTGSCEHWLLACNSKYHLQYLSIVEELMTLLHTEKNYSMMHEYAMMAVNVEPDNPTVLFWLIVALRKHGAIDMAKEHLESAKIRLLREEYQELEERLIAV